MYKVQAGSVTLPLALLGSEGGKLRGKGVSFLNHIAWPQIPTLPLSVNLVGNLLAVSLNLSILIHTKGIVVSSTFSL